MKLCCRLREFLQDFDRLRKGEMLPSHFTYAKMCLLAISLLIHSNSRLPMSLQQHPAALHGSAALYMCDTLGTVKVWSTPFSSQHVKELMGNQNHALE